MITKIITTIKPMLVSSLIVALSLLALTIALIAEHVFGILPCELCVWQRFGFLGIAVGGLSAFIALRKMNKVSYVAPATDDKTAAAKRILQKIALGGFYFTGIAALATAGVAVFHSGVEQHWWQSGCAVIPLTATSLNELREQLLSQQTVSCDKVNWKFLGLSMANWNIPFCIMLAAVSFAGAYLQRKNNR